MEPRIATLLGESGVLDPISLLPLPSAATPRRDDGLTPPRHRHDAAADSALAISTPSTRPSPQRQKSSVPIAEVLNDDPTPPTLPALSVATSNALTQPFSGRLQDILLDSSQQRPNKRRKTDGGSGHTSPSALPAAENALLTLPKPPQLPKKTVRRPRIPPLLQGLHQPPPLPPEAQLFPRITSEGGAFGRNMGEMTALRSPPGRDASKEKETDAPGGKENSDRADGVGVNGASTEKCRKGDRPSPTPGNDGERRIQGTAEASKKGTTKRKENRKRNKWSEQETKDLLHGVSKYGIGNWKKILNDPEYSFTQRTAVDLKDRFRTCCPSDASRSRGNQKSTQSMNEESSTMTDNHDASTQGADSAISTPASAKLQRKVRSDVHKKSFTELAEMGIVSPFQPSKRRQRREFTDRDDENLRKGYERYGPIWHLMRDDKELGFNFRHPTDLRDRFRIRFPEQYAKAGYKLKPKDAQMLKEKEKAADQDEPSIQELSAPASGSQQSDTMDNVDKTPLSHDQATAAASSAPASSNLRSHALLQPLHSSFPTPIQDFPDLISEGDADGDRSPITLNRNIFQWADANPLQSSSTAAITSVNTMPTISSLAGGDAGFNLFTSIDGMHIDPRALRLHLAPMQHSSSLSAPSAYLNPNQIGQIPSISSNLLPNGSDGAFNNSATNSMGTNTSAAAPKQLSNAHLLLTPNLPTIMIPHVPVSSARNAMHNFPPPSDLLSGLEYDATRPEQQQQHAAAFTLEDSLNFGFALPSSVMSGGHASNMGTRGGMNANTMSSVGRGLLMVDKDRDRGSGVDGGGELGERSLLNSAL